MNEEHDDSPPADPAPADGRRVPLATFLVLGITAAVTIMQFRHPPLLDLLGRRPGGLAAGEWWRLVTPLFIHSQGWPHLLINLAWIGFAGVIAERIFGHQRFLFLYFVPGVIGEWISFSWRPFGGGASLGGCGLIGGVCVWLLLRGRLCSWALRVWGPAGLLFGLVLTLRGENHGPPLLAGACLAAVFLRQRTTAG